MYSIWFNKNILFTKNTQICVYMFWGNLGTDKTFICNYIFIALPICNISVVIIQFTGYLSCKFYFIVRTCINVSFPSV